MSRPSSLLRQWSRLLQASRWSPTPSPQSVARKQQAAMTNVDEFIGTKIPKRFVFSPGHRCQDPQCFVFSRGKLPSMLRHLQQDLCKLMLPYTTLKLKVHPNTYALVVSTENITLNAYMGNNRPMLVTNTLFRVGGAAILLSNRRADARRAKYQLVHTVRTHRGAHDQSYGCVTQEEDDAGEVGVSLSKELMVVAGEALKTNITTLSPLVLPMSEQLRFLATVVLNKVFRAGVKAYLPDFKLAFEHFCIHAGGRGVLDELEKSLKLSPWHMEPSRMTLYRFGNTSSSSLWYELAYCEAKGRIKRGDRVWQIAFGSGFKCNSAVWKALRAIDGDAVGENPWIREVDMLPVNVPKVVPIDESSYQIPN